MGANFSIILGIFLYINDYFNKHLLKNTKLNDDSCGYDFINYTEKNNVCHFKAKVITIDDINFYIQKKREIINKNDKGIKVVLDEETREESGSLILDVKSNESNDNLFEDYENKNLNIVSLS